MFFLEKFKLGGYMKEFSKELIRFKRLELGLSLKELSKITKISRSCLSRLETGKLNKLGFVSMIKISQALNIDLLKLIEADNDFLVVSKYFYDIYVRNNVVKKVYE